jgi:hypothetical protein
MKQRKARSRVAKRQNRSNLGSPSGLRSPCDAAHLDCWFDAELAQIENPAVRNVIRSVVDNIGAFVERPNRAMLLWRGCDRICPPGQRAKYHNYPEELKRTLLQRDCKPNTLANGPAVTAFAFAGGTRPERFGSNNAWSVHHLYSGKFPYRVEGTTLRAARSGLHFTQSAGLAAVHPIADGIVDELPCFAWRLRAEAFRRFGYDPNRVFGETHDDLGFVAGSDCTVVWP